MWLGGLGGRWTGQEWRGGGQICIGLSQVQEGSDAARLVAASEARVLRPDPLMTQSLPAPLASRPLARYIARGNATRPAKPGRVGTAAHPARRHPDGAPSAGHGPPGNRRTSRIGALIDINIS